jgi:hypothetical protein
LSTRASVTMVSMGCTAFAAFILPAALPLEDAGDGNGKRSLPCRGFGRQPGVRPQPVPCLAGLPVREASWAAQVVWASVADNAPIVLPISRAGVGPVHFVVAQEDSPGGRPLLVRAWCAGWSERAEKAGGPLLLAPLSDRESRWRDRF